MPDVFVSEKPKHKEVKPRSDQPNVTRHRHLPYKDGLPGHTRSRLAAYGYYPDHVKFVGADEKEKVVLLLRRHVITNLKWMIVSLLLFSTPLVLLLLGFLSTIPADFLFVGLMFWYLISFAFTFEQFLSWFFNVYIITDERVFDVDFVNLVYREMTDANLDQIQDVTVKVGSVIRTVFDYGDVLIQTAAQVPEIDFEAVPHPDRVAQVLRELRVEEEIEKLEGRVR
jgi:uncharacterized membrane protein YdbT with pleckstrin-like domain